MPPFEIPDTLWVVIEPYLPPPKPPTGRPRADERALFNGILYFLKTGCPWSAVPRQYGATSTVHRFHLYLSTHAIYDRIFALMRQHGYDLDQLDLSCCAIDTTTVPAKGGDS